MLSLCAGEAENAIFEPFRTPFSLFLVVMFIASFYLLIAF